MSDRRDCRCVGDYTCGACERAIDQAESARYDREVEPLDQWGRDQDFHWPRGFGGGGSW